MIKYLIEDDSGEIHEVRGDERVLVLAGTQACAEGWLRDNGLPPYGRQFTVSPVTRALEGGRWPVIILTNCFDDRRDAHQALRTLDANAAKMPTPPRRIRVTCP